MFNFKKILVPTDFSRQSRLALDTAIILARKEKESTIILFHVLPIFREYEYMDDWVDDFNLKQKKSAMVALNQLAKKVPSHINTSIEVGNGNVEEEILRVCKKKAANLIVMTTHGRRGLDRALHPNASEEVVRVAPCPVLVLHQNAKTLAPEEKKLVRI